MMDEVCLRNITELARLTERIDSLEKKIDYRFERLEMFFTEVERNTTFRKRSNGGLKVVAVIMPIIAAIFILL